MAVPAWSIIRKMKPIPHAALALALAIAGLAPLRLPAQEEDSNRLAKQFYEQGIRYYEQGDNRAAAEAFREAYKVRPSWKILFNIGQTEAAAGHYGLAVEAFEQYLVEGKDAIEQERRDYVLGEIQRMKVLVGTLVIHGPDGAAVFVDDMNRGELPAAQRVKVEAGERHVVVSTNTGVLLRNVIRMSGGDEVVLEANPSRASVPHPSLAPVAGKPSIPGPSPREGEGKPKETGSPLLWTWVTLGVGGAAGVTAAITGGVALSKGSDVKDQCPHNVCPAGLKGDIDEVKRLNLATDILIGVAAAGGAAALILYFVESAQSEEADSSHAAKAEVHVTPFMAGLSISGRY